MWANDLEPTRVLGLTIGCALVFSGCVTTSDLDKVNERVASRIEAMEAKNHTQFRELQAELKELRTVNEALRSELGGISKSVADIRADSRSVVEAVKEAEQARGRMATKLEAEIVRNREGLAAYAGRSAEALQKIAARMGEVSGEVRSLRGGVMATLLGSYRAEEASLRQRLEAVTETRQHLESIGGATREVDDPGVDRNDAPRSVVERAKAEE